MAQKHINTSTPNDNLGDTLRDANIKCEDNFTELYQNKVDKIGGKGLSTNDYTTLEKNKLAGIPADAEKNVQADFLENDTQSDAYIKNKPTFVTSVNWGDIGGVLSGQTDLWNQFESYPTFEYVDSKVSQTINSGITDFSPSENAVRVELNTKADLSGAIFTGAISATTYLGLPKDIYVTGGTYSSGTTLFTNNTGGTFSVSGFSTGTTIGIVSATGSGIVNNVLLQELGGVDKVINGVRIGLGAGTNSNSTAFGINVLSANTTGVSNTGVGKGVLSANTTGYSNTGVGTESLISNTIGASNTAFGEGSLRLNTTGYGNTAIGRAAMGTSISSNNNSALGQFALYSNTSGTQNTAIGNHSLYYSTASGNIGVGYLAGTAITTGARNVIIASQPSFISAGITTGSNNLIVSQNDGQNTGITNGSGNTIIGKVTGLSASLANTVVLSDGVGTQRLISNSSNLTTLPTQTTALITGDATGKSIVTKEYLNSYTGNSSVTFSTGALSSNSYKLNVLQTAPTSSTDTGVTGEIRYTDTYIYLCIATNLWVRSPLSTF